MKLKLLLGLMPLLFLTASAVGQEGFWNTRFRYDRDREDGAPFGSREFNLDLFGTYATRDLQGSSDEEFGGGAGVTFFFNRYIGIGADSYIEDWEWPDRINGNLVLRLPVPETGFAPYAIGGGTRQWRDVPQWMWNVGGGVEFRFNRYTGIFIDGRRFFPEISRDYSLWRAGLRLAF